MIYIHKKILSFQIIHYMSKEDQVVQEKVLTFKTISNSHLQQVANFVVSQYKHFDNLNEETKSKLSWVANLMLIPVARCQWSFGLFENQQLVGVYLQIDLIDYLNTIKVIDSKSAAELFQVGQFHEYFLSLEPSIKRGDYMLSIFNTTKSHRPMWANRQQITLIHQGFYLCKLGGWKNIIFQTDNPIPFMKINGEVVVEGELNPTEKRKYLMKITMNQFNLSVSPFQKIYSKL